MIADELKARYLRDRVPVRLGNLASSLLHLRHALHGRTLNVYATRMLNECRAFVALTLADADARQQDALEQLGTQLEQWHQDWKHIVCDETVREAVTVQVEKWSDVILAVSGILDDEIWTKYHR